MVDMKQIQKRFLRNLERAVILVVTAILCLGVAHAAAPSATSPVDLDFTYGTSSVTISWTITDADNATGFYVITLDGTVSRDNSTWTNITAFTYYVSTTETVGSHTVQLIYTDDNFANNLTDDVTYVINIGGGASQGTPTSGTEEAEADYTNVIIIIVLGGIVIYGLKASKVI